MKFNIKTDNLLEEKSDLAIILSVKGAELPEKLSERFLADDF